MLAGLHGKAFISKVRSEGNRTPLKPEIYPSSLKEGSATNKCLAPDQVQQIPVLNHTTLDLGRSKNACITSTCAATGESYQSCHSWQQVCFGGLLCGTSNTVFVSFSYGSASLKSEFLHVHVSLQSRLCGVVLSVTCNLRCMPHGLFASSTLMSLRFFASWTSMSAGKKVIATFR